MAPLVLEPRTSHLFVPPVNGPDYNAASVYLSVCFMQYFSSSWKCQHHACERVSCASSAFYFLKILHNIGLV